MSRQGRAFRRSQLIQLLRQKFNTQDAGQHLKISRSSEGEKAETLLLRSLAVSSLALQEYRS